MEVGQLPRGRHGMSREAVARSQRERMLRAIAEAVSDLGYSRTPVAEVLRRAGVSRETFYEQFTNKEDCFLAAYEAAAEVLIGKMGEGIDSLPPDKDAVERIEGILTRYLTALAAEPAIARTFLVEVYAAGPTALARRVEVQARFVETVAGLIGARTERQRFACEALVATVSALVTQRVCAGRAAEVGELTEPLVNFVRATIDAHFPPPASP